MFSPIPDHGPRDLQEDCFRTLVQNHVNPKAPGPASFPTNTLCGKKRRIPDDALAQNSTNKRRKVDENSDCSAETPSTVASESLFKPLPEEPAAVKMDSGISQDLNLGPSLISVLKRDIKRRAYSHDEPDVD
jgi:hypothetical protein